MGNICTNNTSCRMLRTKVREMSKECHNSKANNHKSKKRTKSSTASSLFPKRGNRNAKRIEKKNHKNKMPQGNK